MRNRNLSVTTALGGLCLLVGCGNPLSVGVVAVGVTGPPVVSPMEQAAFEVTVVNRGEDRVVWGRGSSSCQLGLLVTDADGERHAIDFRGCTDDLAEQGLDPGASRTERFLWGGHIAVDGEWFVLPAGEYRVIGVAGDRAESAPLRVTVAAP